MEIDFQQIQVSTVKPTYSWDTQTPNSYISESASLSGTTYIGYAPSVNLSFYAGFKGTNNNSFLIKREVDFGDYYNSQTNTETSSFSGVTKFSHTYVMPGTYTITLTQTEYSKYTFPCYEEPCNEQAVTDRGVYIETSVRETKRPSFTCLWYNFFEFDYDPEQGISRSLDPTNELLRWEECEFQGSKQITWKEMEGPAIEITHGDGSWTSNTVTSQFSATIEVREIPPSALLTIVETPSSKANPYTVKISPKLTRCGSFPIDKIIWNMGDGSPNIEISRYNAPDSSNIIYTGLFESDIYDPRNYDIVHTFFRQSETDGCFYPSITAIASSTSTTDCAAIAIGPIEFASVTNFHLLQNQLLTDKTKAYLGEIDNSVGLWNYK